MGELKMDLGNFGRTVFDGVVIPAGTEELLYLAEDTSYVLVLLRGRVTVSREENEPASESDPNKRRRPPKRKKKPSITGTPASPVILTTPGTYRLFATQHCVCLRAERS